MHIVLHCFARNIARILRAQFDAIRAVANIIISKKNVNESMRDLLSICYKNYRILNVVIINIAPGALLSTAERTTHNL